MRRSAPAEMVAEVGRPAHHRPAEVEAAPRIRSSHFGLAVGLAPRWSEFAGRSWHSFAEEMRCATGKRVRRQWQASTMWTRTIGGAGASSAEQCKTVGQQYMHWALGPRSHLDLMQLSVWVEILKKKTKKVVTI